MLLTGFFLRAAGIADCPGFKLLSRGRCKAVLGELEWFSICYIVCLHLPAAAVGIIADTPVLRNETIVHFIPVYGPAGYRALICQIVVSGMNVLIWRALIQREPGQLIPFAIQPLQSRQTAHIERGQLIIIAVQTEQSRQAAHIERGQLITTAKQLLQG